MTDLPENLWKSPVIQQRLVQEALFDCRYGVPAEPFFDVIVPQADTKSDCIQLRNYTPSMSRVAPHPIQVQFAKNLLSILMKELHFNGLWIVGWTHPPTAYAALTDMDNAWQRLIIIWLDKDGDPQYTIDYDKPVVDIIADGLQRHVEKIEDAHQQWREIYSNERMKEDMLLTDEQQKRVTLESMKHV